MLFTDLFFLAYFLPVFLVLCRVLAWLGRGRADSAIPTGLRLFIIAATLAFYGFENAWWIGIFVAVVLPPYLAAFGISRTDSEPARRWLVATGVVSCLLALVLFKYLNWFSTLLPTLAPLRLWIAGPFGNGQQIELPPGVSFYVFEAISFLVDIYRRRVPFPSGPLDYASFICLFPRFIAGPIVRYTDVREQIQRWPGMDFQRGLLLFGLGFALKIGFADQCAKFVPYAFASWQPDFWQSWIGSIAYSFQLYFDFWGYSVMAMGLGLCLGFSFPDNFLLPYQATSITDFWRRWHVSLSSWLRDYLYISLGGNRCSPGRRYFNLLATMTLAGLWHGASPLFLLWGLYHGLLLAFERAFGLDQSRGPWAGRLLRIYTLLAVLVGWVAFRSDSWQQAAGIYRGLVGLNGFGGKFNGAFLEQNLFSAVLAVGAILFWLAGEKRLLDPARGGLQAHTFGERGKWLILLAFAAALFVRFGEDGVPFLYFQF